MTYDEEFLKNTIKGYTKVLYNFIRRFGFNNEEAEDILQDVFIKVWKYEGTFDGTKSSIKTWLYRIARNTIYDALRKKKVAINIISIDEQNSNGNKSDVEDISQDIITVLENLQTKSDIIDAINTLSVEEKSILLLHVEESMTFNEIGVIFDLQMNTVKSKYRRSLLKLHSVLENMHQNKI